MTARLLALLLVLSIWPTTVETVELVAHWVEYGDAAHADADSHQGSPIGTDEHGCSGMFHLCSCHAGIQAALTATGSPRPGVVRRSSQRVPDPSNRVGCEDPAPAFRPPIA